MPELALLGRERGDALDRTSHNLKSAGLFQEEHLDIGIVGWNTAWCHHIDDPPPDPLDPAPPELLPPGTTRRRHPALLTRADPS